jgi:Tol biopolymer transport system component
MKTSKIFVINYRIKELILVLLLFILSSCSDSSTEPLLERNVICYEKHIDAGYWEVFSNNLSGSSPSNISQYKDDDEYPVWSPDGRYIAFTRSIENGGPLCIVFDSRNNSYTNITNDGGGVPFSSGWTSDNKIYLSYSSPLGSSPATYLMNPDGSNKIKILDFAARLYFYNDGQTFLYNKNNQIFKTNVDKTINEFILDCDSGNGRYINISDFNPVNETFLVNTNYYNEGSSDLAEFNVSTKQLNLLLKSEDDYPISLQRYSKDYSTICFIEENDKTQVESYLSVYKGGKKNRLLKLTGNEWFDYNPMQFSPDGRYIAFSKNIYNSGTWVSWNSYLYVIDINNGDLHYIDDGISPSWNPRSSK